MVFVWGLYSINMIIWSSFSMIIYRNVLHFGPIWHNRYVITVTGQGFWAGQIWHGSGSGYNYKTAPALNPENKKHLASASPALKLKKDSNWIKTLSHQSKHVLDWIELIFLMDFGQFVLAVAPTFCQFWLGLQSFNHSGWKFLLKFLPFLTLTKWAWCGSETLILGVKNVFQKFMKHRFL